MTHGGEHKSQAQLQCEGRGGKWDGQKCILPEPKPDKIEVLQDESGTFLGEVTLPDGRTFTQLNADDLQNLKDIQNKKKSLLEGTQPAGTTAAAAKQASETKERVGGLLESQKQGETKDRSGEGIVQEDIVITDEQGNKTTIPAGTFVSPEQAASLGLTSQSIGSQQLDLITAGLAIGASGSVGAFGGPTSKVGGFLSRIFARSKAVSKPVTGAARGSRALGTNPRALGTNPRAVAQQSKGVLRSPARAIASSKKLTLTNAILLGGFVGLPSIKGISSKLINKNVDRIEAEVSKLGEQLTKIPEAHSLGVSIDEDGNVFLYTDAIALANVEEIEQTLIESERALQTAGIGNTILRLTGRLTTAQFEIDKQRRELTVARGKILRNIANPTPALQNTRDLFSQFAVEEEE